MASTPSSNARSPIAGVQTVLPYRIHFSQRYLDLTRQKLALTRLPRDPQSRSNQWDLGVAKTDLEPLVDHWSEEYDWRQQEAFYNEALPQYRLAIYGTRIHFVHRRSMMPNAIPILFVHAWPESFITISNIIETLCNPVSTLPRGEENVPAFHVVVPSIPGFGCSDQVSEEGNNIATTAEAFDALMRSLGYTQYIAHGSGWGFRICRMIALTHPESCMAVHTCNPDVPPPRNNMGYITPQDMPPPPVPLHGRLSVSGLTPPLSPASAQQQAQGRPQTIAYALCDSPAGLLAHILEAIKPPFGNRTEPTSPGSSGLQNPWTSTAIIDWTMLYWLPGPESALRWLANSWPLAHNLWKTYSNVPLAISLYGEHNTSQEPATWAEAYHRIAMLRRRPGMFRFPVWERPADVAQDLRDLANLVTPSHFGHFGAGVGMGS